MNSRTTRIILRLPPELETAIREWMAILPVTVTLTAAIHALLRAGLDALHSDR